MDLKEQNTRFEQWLVGHAAIFYRVVNGFATGDDRNDLMQEVLLAIWKAVPVFREQAQPTTFLYRVSHNAALSWHRTRRNYRLRIEQAERLGVISEHLATPHPKLDLLYAAIRQLPELDRSLILLSLDGVSYRDMADIHGLSESNVGVRLNRIRKQLTQTLNSKYEP